MLVRRSLASLCPERFGAASGKTGARDRRGHAIAENRAAREPVVYYVSLALGLERLVRKLLDLTG
jgi:hypothetical protein